MKMMTYMKERLERLKIIAICMLTATMTFVWGIGDGTHILANPVIHNCANESSADNRLPGEGEPIAKGEPIALGVDKQRRA